MSTGPESPGNSLGAGIARAVIIAWVVELASTRYDPKAWAGRAVLLHLTPSSFIESVDLDPPT